jgi:hypothetical protein
MKTLNDVFGSIYSLERLMGKMNPVNIPTLYPTP